ncbi:MAG: F0F1 ATP synthase subunit A [Acidobacteriaceae bacterium]|nr:F0F1 ATP synthase subunit A [Acidobacteriaceae bacterium]MBV8572389.1 F0F1 ATP synthase subunit A [Acidobacteriaceae bacterium]
MHHHELWITGLLNDYLAGPANALLNAVNHPAADARYPWADWMVCEIIVVLFTVVLFGYLRSRLSVDRPGKLQHTFEFIYDFVRSSSEEVAGEQGPKYVAFFGTIFIFILFMNLIGIIPGFVSPTMYAMVPLGLAVSTFLFYNGAGIRQQGLGYAKQFLGPMLFLAPLMIPIEIISNLARPLSLTVRLFANMFAGEQVYLTFLQLTKFLVPVIFIGLHTFVSLLQAYIFMLLAMVYVGGAVSHEH